MLSAIVFSKDRPLQLQAYLESLRHYSGIKDPYINVLYKATGDISYQKLTAKYPEVRWWPEVDFRADLEKILAEAENYILWGVDDVFYKSAFNLNTCIEALAKEPELFGFSLRLGLNIQPYPALTRRKKYLLWDWSAIDLPHWKYPWEVSGSVYRKSDALEWLNHAPTRTNPNYLEAEPADHFEKHRPAEKKYLACFELSKCLLLTVNRVQETHPNPVDMSKSTDLESCYHAFLADYRLNWNKFHDCRNPAIHSGAEYYELQTHPAARLKNYSRLNDWVIKARWV